MKKLLVTIIRMTVDGHFLYERLMKLFDRDWSVGSFLTNMFGFSSGFCHWPAISSARSRFVAWLNRYGLLLPGICLYLGIVVKWGFLGGIILLTLYYFAYPLSGVSLPGIHDGNVTLREILKSEIGNGVGEINCRTKEAVELKKFVVN